MDLPSVNMKYRHVAVSLSATKSFCFTIFKKSDSPVVHWPVRGGWRGAGGVGREAGEGSRGSGRGRGEQGEGRGRGEQGEGRGERGAGGGRGEGVVEGSRGW